MKEATIVIAQKIEIAMILPTMTYQEIEKTFRREIATAIPKIDEVAKRFGRMVKTTYRYPLTREFLVQTKDRTKLNLLFVADKRSSWDHPKLCIYSTFQYKDGLYAISVPGGEGDAHILTKHFFDRYRERIVKDSEMGAEDLIRRYMINNKDMGWFPNASIFSADYQKYEKEGTLQLAARVVEGNCFAEQIGRRLFLIRTILPDDMLGESQAEAFAVTEKLRREASPFA